VSTHIKRLIAEGENESVDFKFEISDSRKLARTLVAFSNTGGGTLLIGVKDNGRVAGVRSEEEYYMLEAAAELYCRPQVHYDITSWDMEGRTVLEITIPKSTTIPHYAKDDNGKWMAYIRVKDQNLLANSIQLKVWKRGKRRSGTFVSYTEKEKLLLEYLRSNGKITLSRFRKLGRLSRKKAEIILVNLITLNVVEMEVNEKETLYILKKDPMAGDDTMSEKGPYPPVH